MNDPVIAPHGLRERYGPAGPPGSLTLEVPPLRLAAGAV